MKIEDNETPHLTFVEQASKPATPAAGNRALYFKTDNKLYVEDESGTETEVGAGAGTIGGSTGSTDNAVILANGTGGVTIQASPGGVTINDAGSINIPSGQTYNINNVAHTHAGGSAPTHAYFSQLCAMLEPLAVEPLQKGTFSYAVASNVTKYLVASWSTRLGADGRMEVRDPRQPLQALRGCTLTGLESGSMAILLDPALPTYTDAWTTYYDRLNLIATSVQTYLSLVARNTYYRFLPGPYGSIITHITSYDRCWVSGRPYGTALGFNLMNEISDTAIQRIGNNLLMPVSKNILSKVLTSDQDGSGGILYYNCPAAWGKVADATTYVFRDDFTGAALDTATVWTRAESSVGNVEIVPSLMWCKLKGNNSNWGNDGAYSQSDVARSTQPYFVVDFSMAASGNSYGFMLGFSDGGGHSYSNFAHGLLIQQSGDLKVYENGNDRGAVGTGFTLGDIYRLRIRALSGGGATYEMQGGTQYGAIGSATWTSVTPGGSSSATTSLHAGMAGSGGGDNYISDVRVY